MTRAAILLVSTCVLASCPAAFAQKPAAAEEGQKLAAQVMPLLKTKCMACHGDDPKKIKGGLDMRTRESTLRGGEHGVVLVPGKAKQSKLYIAVTWEDIELEMPPKENDRLTPDQVELVRRWIDAGAPWPAAGAQPKAVGDVQGKPGGVTVATSGGLSPDWTNRTYDPADLWAYRPLMRVAPPAQGKAPGNAAHPVDAFIAAKLAANAVQPAPPADRRTLIRRAYFDLLGLPPGQAEVERFAADASPDAFGKVIDQLLASKHYGERMAQHWLDVVRYADTAGFSNDYERPHAWRYRDYVIRSFNQDKPFDRFAMEQLAGDEIDPKDPELAIATGFLRMGPWEQTAMSVAAVTRQQWLDDVTNSVGLTFMAQAMSCCKCHDHKFDPLPTRDYYSFQSIFAATQFDDRAAAFGPSENQADFAALKERVARLNADQGLRPLQQTAGDGFKRIGKKRGEFLKREAQRTEPIAFSVRSDQPQDIHILTGGSLESPAARVEPDVLSAVESMAGVDGAIPVSGAGRRLALAKWVGDPDNALVARVVVNRVWQWHFGTGIAGTPNNFGKTGKRPTHPELLDWLAGWFVENGWSIKKLHRLIMTSAAYQRSGGHPDIDALRKADPNGELLAVFPPRRLSAEEMRDAMLAATGELSPTAGGPGVFPEINWEAALQPRHIMGGTVPAYQPSPTPEQRNRRTIYAFRVRGLSDPMLEVFNRPGTDASCERRDETTITPQVFALFNGQFVNDRALALAARIDRDGREGQARVDEAFRLALGRLPSDVEREAAIAHVARMTEHHRRTSPVKVEPPRSVVREMIEEQTGVSIRWEERLDVMDAYQSDTKPWDVPPETRALAELCLVLFNSNEFLHVY